MLWYDFPAGVEAFSTERPDVLPYDVVQAHQTHTAEVAVIERPGVTREELEGIDAMVTDVPGVAIGVRTADCIPVLLYDPVHRAVAAVHAGWRGTVADISAAAIRVMAQRYGTLPSDLVAQIGPGIGPDSFQVGEEVVAAFEKAGFPMSLIHTCRGPRIEGTMEGGHHLDLWAANRWLLERAGVPSSSIQVAGICTYASNDRFFSARREGIRCPRIISSIRLLERG